MFKEESSLCLYALPHDTDFEIMCIRIELLLTVGLLDIDEQSKKLLLF